MDLRQLQTIVHVAELGSLAKAAERLHVAQPALSRQVRLLEAELGVSLFERHGRGMRPTDAAVDILEHARRVMVELDHIRAAVSDEHLALRGHVSIGMPPTVGDILTTPIAAGFRHHHPDATLRVVGAYSGYLLDWLQRGEIDLAILFDGPPLPSIQTLPLVDEDLFLIGPPDCGLSANEAVSFDALAQCTLLLPSRVHGLRRLIDDIARQRRVELRTSVEADSYQALKNLVKARHGMTILPLAPIYEETLLGQLSYAPIIEPTPTRRLVLATPVGRTATPLSRFAVSMIESRVEELVRCGEWPGTIPGPGGPSTGRE